MIISIHETAYKERYGYILVYAQTNLIYSDIKGQIHN